MSYSYQVLDEKQENTAEQKWFMEHCWEYGFILRYPKDKMEITGIGYEPWHYRYVGREAAAEMKELGLCLEEYIQMLENPMPAEQELTDAPMEEMNQETAAAVS
jgi:D-alanyl-D-alanine carboxypeptidase